MTIAELTTETAEYLQRNQGTSEFDMSINVRRPQVSRSLKKYLWYSLLQK